VPSDDSLENRAVKSAALDTKTVVAQSPYLGLQTERESPEVN
jgi:hypothetical protein